MRDLPDDYSHQGASEIALRISPAHLGALGKKLVLCGATARCARQAIPQIAWEIGDYIFNGAFQEDVSDADAKAQSTRVAEGVSELAAALEDLSGKSEAILELGLTDDHLPIWRELKRSVRRLHVPLSHAAAQVTPKTGLAAWVRRRDIRALAMFRN